MEPIVIEIEGIDNCGKTTLINKIVKRLQEEKDIMPYVFSEIDYAVPISGEIVAQAVNPKSGLDDYEREQAFCITSTISNLYHANQVRPNAVVIKDRGLLSQIAYSRACLNDQDWESASQSIKTMVNNPSIRGFNKHPEVFFLNVSPQTVLNRLQEGAWKSGDVIENQGKELQEKVYNAYTSKELMESVGVTPGNVNINYCGPDIIEDMIMKYINNELLKRSI